jgi:hypothetical protein
MQVYESRIGKYGKVKRNKRNSHEMMLGLSSEGHIEKGEITNRDLL